MQFETDARAAARRGVTTLRTVVRAEAVVVPLALALVVLTRTLGAVAEVVNPIVVVARAVGSEGVAVTDVAVEDVVVTTGVAPGPTSDRVGPVRSRAGGPPLARAAPVGRRDSAGVDGGGR